LYDPKGSALGHNVAVPAFAEQCDVFLYVRQNTFSVNDMVALLTSDVYTKDVALRRPVPPVLCSIFTADAGDDKEKMHEAFSELNKAIDKGVPQAFESEKLTYDYADMSKLYTHLKVPFRLNILW